jgi:hypothetical protein
MKLADGVMGWVISHQSLDTIFSPFNYVCCKLQHKTQIILLIQRDKIGKKTQLFEPSFFPSPSFFTAVPMKPI